MISIRFDREIAIGVPDKPGRLEIMQVHTRGMPLAEDVDLERLAHVTHGYVGADLHALCREAAMARLRRILPSIDFELDRVPYDELEGLSIHMEDFQDALAVGEPSAIREVFTEVPDVRWSNIGGLERQQISRRSNQWPTFVELFSAPPPQGDYGVGKTLLAKAGSGDFIWVGPALMSRWVGETGGRCAIFARRSLLRLISFSTDRRHRGAAVAKRPR
jgi:transitional endoplasmic reticulum ATPase